MAKPSISTRWWRPLLRLLLLVLFSVSAPSGADAGIGGNTLASASAAGASGFAPNSTGTTTSGLAWLHVAGLGSNTPSDKGLWSQADAMVNRLREERRKLNLIFQEIERLQYMGQDFRDLQLYPTGVTGLKPEDDVKLDRMIEGLEKHVATMRKQVIELEKPLDDAFFIAKEMLQESPNQDMVDLLLKDNVDRIGKLIAVQKELNKRWDEAFTLLGQYRDRVGIKGANQNGGLIEDDFFKILMANVGRASQRFYNDMNDYKDSLAARSDRAAWEKMANLDLGRIKERIGTKSIEMVQEDLERLSQRFHGRISIGLVNYYLGVTFMEGGKPLKAAEAYAKVTPDSRMYGPSALGVLQALFETGQDDSLVVRYRAYLAANAFDGKLLPPARFLAVQSCYALGLDSLLEVEALASVNKNAYHFKSLFVYVKSLVRTKRYPEARNVLVTLVSESQLETRLHNQAILALAHLNFEEAHYEAGLKGYQNLLDQPGFQAEALYGMVWCNIRMGDLDAAEFILKKLITQYPDNPSAMDGFMVLVRKLMLKAKSEWAFRVQIDRENDQLQEFNKKLSDRVANKLMSDEEIKTVRAKLAKAEAVLSRQKPLTVEAVARLYQQGLSLCDFVDERYKTGEYSEQVFNREREAVLAKLDDPGRTLSANADSAAIDSVGFRKEIKQKLFESRALALDIHIMHKSWLEELLKYSQRKLLDQMAAIKNDSTKKAQRADLLHQSHLLADDISERLAFKSDDILRRIRELVEDPNSTGIMDWLLFQKGYLNYGVEEDGLKKKMASFQWLENQTGGKPLVGQSEPTLDPESYETPWKELIEKYPESQYVPAALYYLGFTLNARGEYVPAIRYFEEMVKRFPQSPYAQQALIFIGEYYFNENKLDKAAEAYDKVLDFPDSKYFEQALYKLAWTRYRESSYKGAISSFTYILQEAGKKPKASAKSGLTNEALQFAALSIAESDTTGDGGLRQSKTFSDKLGDARLGAKLLHKMAIIYTQQGRLDRAKRALESLLNGYPEYDRIPEAMMELGRAYEKEQDFQRAAEVREKIFRLYHRDGDWYKKLPTEEAKSIADSVSETAMDLVAHHYLYEAKQLHDAVGEMAHTRENYFRKAISAYETFLQIYPENAHKAKYNYEEAEAYYSLEDFAAAAKKYMQVSQMSDAKLKKAAAYNAIVAAQELLKKADDVKK